MRSTALYMSQFTYTMCVVYRVSDPNPLPGWQIIGDNLVKIGITCYIFNELLIVIDWYFSLRTLGIGLWFQC